ncbi:hypothetical protein, partial [Mesorhizobium sp. M8A.F.Ca.ET.197.01.1.1]|uniref:hypothetical protein n=1 Tax=Mesorhizobium sp. M8A.F.Ca.ET.197.01.1.1 TaxID=2563965 RepID=UPI001AEDE3C3
RTHHGRRDDGGRRQYCRGAALKKQGDLPERPVAFPERRTTLSVSRPRSGLKPISRLLENCSNRSKSAQIFCLLLEQL